MNSLPLIRQRLGNYITKKGLTFREVSLKIGRKDSYIQQFVRYGFPKRLNEVDRKKICHLLEIDEMELIDDELLQQGAKPGLIIDENINKEDFINIDIYAVTTQSSELYKNIIGRMALSYSDFNSWNSRNPYYSKILRVDSDCMEPAINKGSLLIYDSSVNEYLVDGIYVVRYYDAVMIRRVQKCDETSLILKNDNPRYSDQRAEIKKVEILGIATYCLIGRQL